MAVKIDFKTNNAAFEDPTEIGRILREISRQIDAGVMADGIRDINGNKIGKYSIKR